jgi:hypothetical protein
MTSGVESDLDLSHSRRAHPDAIPAPRRPEADFHSGWERDYAPPECPRPACRSQRLLDEDVDTFCHRITEAERIGKSCISRTCGSRCWRPTSVEAILAGRTDQALMLEKLERPLPPS